jgi:2-C-methyl-D-erythritol 4-phosphate cytidylyltransferase
MGRVVIITAGGAGLRLGSELPKQFHMIGDWPVLLWAAKPFLEFDPSIQIIFSIPESYLAHCQGFSSILGKEVLLLSGGPTRFHSVQHAVQVLPSDTWVAVHDGVRPLVTPETISRVFLHALQAGNAVPCIESSDSLREVTGDRHFPVSRDRIRFIQTPQVFYSEVLREAYQKAYLPTFTDDASLVESLGHSIHLMEGQRGNIKITYQPELEWARFCLDGVNWLDKK